QQRPERSRYSVERHRLREQARVPHLVAAAPAEEPGELLFLRATTLERLPLEAAKGVELALLGDHRLDTIDSECPDELELEVGVIDEHGIEHELEIAPLRGIHHADQMLPGELPHRTART